MFGVDTVDVAMAELFSGFSDFYNKIIWAADWNSTRKATTAHSGRPPLLNVRVLRAPSVCGKRVLLGALPGNWL